MCKRKTNIKMKAMSKKYVTEKEGWTKKDIQENKFWKDMDRWTDSCKVKKSKKEKGIDRHFGYVTDKIGSCKECIRGKRSRHFHAIIDYGNKGRHIIMQ